MHTYNTCACTHRRGYHVDAPGRNRLQLVARCAVQIIEIVTSAESLTGLITMILRSKVPSLYQSLLCAKFLSLSKLTSSSTFRVKTIAFTNHIGLRDIRISIFERICIGIFFLYQAYTCVGESLLSFSLPYIEFIFLLYYCNLIIYKIIIIQYHLNIFQIINKLLNFMQNFILRFILLINLISLS